MKRADNVPPGGVTYIGERGPEIVMPLKPKRRTFNQTAFFVPSIVAYYMATVGVLAYSAGAWSGVAWALIGAPFAFLIVTTAIRENAAKEVES